MPGARQETNVPSSAETTTIAASETMLAEFALTLFLDATSKFSRYQLRADVNKTEADEARQCGGGPTQKHSSEFPNYSQS